MERVDVENVGEVNKVANFCESWIKIDAREMLLMFRWQNKKNTKQRSGVHILRAAPKIYKCINT